MFALVPEEEILSVTCRGRVGKDDPATDRLGARNVKDAGWFSSGHDTSEDFTTERRAEAQRLLALSKTDPTAAVSYIESLSEPTRQMLLSNIALNTFVENYYKQGGPATPEAVLEGRGALEALGEDSFADHVDMYDAKQKQMVLADADLKAAYDRSVEKRTKKASLSEKELDLEAIERQKAMRAKSQHQIDDMKNDARPCWNYRKSKRTPTTS